MYEYMPTEIAYQGVFFRMFVHQSRPMYEHTVVRLKNMINPQEIIMTVYMRVSPVYFDS